MTVISYINSVLMSFKGVIELVVSLENYFIIEYPHQGLFSFHISIYQLGPKHIKVSLPSVRTMPYPINYCPKQEAKSIATVAWSYNRALMTNGQFHPRDSRSIQVFIQLFIRSNRSWRLGAVPTVSLGFPRVVGWASVPIGAVLLQSSQSQRTLKWWVAEGNYHI